MPECRSNHETHLQTAQPRFGALVWRIYELCIVALFVVFAGAAVTDGALAGDVAERDIIGFSSDGRYFAFREHGTQSETDAAYANTYIIDTRGGGWVDGSPVRFLEGTTERDVFATRDEAQAAADALLDTHGVQRGRKGRTLATRPLTDIDAEARRITVVDRARVIPLDQPVTFGLRSFALSSQRCPAAVRNLTQGFGLKVQIGEQPPNELHIDQRLPVSRGCPLDYRISDVIHYAPNGKDALFIVLIGYEPHRKDGRDYRYLVASHWTTVATLRR